DDLDLAVAEPGVGVLGVPADGLSAGTRRRAVDPRDDRPGRQGPRRGQGTDADLGALARQALAEEQDQPEAGERQPGDEPDVVDDPVHAGQPFMTSTSVRSMDRRLR